MVGPATNVQVHLKLYFESSTVIVSWEPPTQTNGQDSKSFSYIVQYRRYKLPKTQLNTTAVYGTSITIDNLMSNQEYECQVLVFDNNKNAGKISTTTFFATAKSGNLII